MRIKLLDFGISKFAAGGPFVGHESPVTSTQALMGSPVYMAPEQMRSTKHVDGRADIWSLGVILYELLSGGRSPFEGETLPEVCMRVMRETPEPLEASRTDLPQGLVAVVTRCLEKDPARRFPNAASLAIALAPFASYDGQLFARRMQRRPSAAPPSPREAPPEVIRPAPVANVPPAEPALKIQPTQTPPLAFANPAWSPQTPASDPLPPGAHAPGSPFDSRIAWATVALSAFVVVSAASFAAGVRVSSAGRPDAAHPAMSPFGSTGVTNPMPHATPAASAMAPIVLVETPPWSETTEHVYAPEELPLAQPVTKHATQARPNRM